MVKATLTDKEKKMLNTLLYVFNQLKDIDYKDLNITERKIFLSVREAISQAEA